MHTEALERSVRGHGLELYDARGEGDCQFKALHHQLASRKLVRDDDTNSFKHQTVRQLAVVGMEDFNADAQETALAEYRATHPGNEACTYDEFLDRMRQPGAVWGANESLEGAARQLASQVLRRPVRIRVHKEHGEPMLVTSWGDGQDPAEDTVVTLNLVLQGETHYYSTVALGDAGETNKRRREDDEGGKIGSKRVSLGVGGEESFGASDSEMTSSDHGGGDDDEDGDDDDEDEGGDDNDEDSDDDEDDGLSDPQQKSGKKQKTEIKGLLYRCIPAQDVVDRSLAEEFLISDATFDVCVSLEKKGSAPRQVYTRRCGQGSDGLWHMWPLVEGVEGFKAQTLHSPWICREQKERYGGHLGDDGRRCLPDCVSTTATDPEATACVTLDVEEVPIPDACAVGGKQRKPKNEKKKKQKTITMLRSLCVDEKLFKEFNRTKYKDKPGGVEGALERVRNEVEARNVGTPFPEDLKQQHVKLGQRLDERDKALRAERRATGGALAKQVLADYDAEIRQVDGWIEDDTEQRAMDEADGARSSRHHDSHSSIPDTEAFWASTWRHAVHEGGRRWLVECLENPSKSLSDRIEVLVSDDEDRTSRILREIGWDADTHTTAIMSRHLKGEALELLACYLPRVRGKCEIMDYLSGSPEDPRHVSTTVERVIMSSAPVGSPFRLPEEGYFSNLLGGENDAKKEELAKALESYCLMDRAFDVIVVLKEALPDEENSREDSNNDSNINGSRYHFQVMQCKLRQKKGAAIKIAGYVGHLARLVELAKEAGSLVRLDWVSTCYRVKALEYTGDFASLKDKGWIDTMLHQNFLDEGSTVLEAVGRARDGFGSGSETREPEMPLPNLRPFQERMLVTLRNERQNGTRRGTIVAATGSGKTRLMTEDGLESQEEGGHRKPLLAIAPSIYLVHQLATSFALTERAKLNGSSDTRRRHNYVVCSDTERSSTPLLRSITNDQVPAVMLRHHREGDLGYCRFFTTVQGAGRFWNKVMDFIRVTEGIDASLDESLDDPVFQTCIRDEVHSMSGPNDAVWTLGLNIPAVWSASYTATPTVETRSRAAMLRLLKEERRRQREEEGDDDEENEESDEGDDQRQREVRENEDEEDDHHDETSGAEFTVRCSSAGTSSNGVMGSEYGLSGIQVLSRSLQFESLERVLGDASGKEEKKALARVLLDAWSKKKGSIDWSKVERSLGVARDMVLFDVRPELDTGDCCCPAGGRHRNWCPASASQPDADQSHNQSHDQSQGQPTSRKEGIFRAYVDDNGKLEWTETSNLTKGQRVGADAIVLGRHKAKDDTFTLCMRRGDEQDVRGLVVHDSTDNDHGENLIGPALATYTFGEAFAEKDPQRILAQPAVATYIIDPVSIPVARLDAPEHEDAEFMDVDGITEDLLSVEHINACLGYSIEKQRDPETNRTVPVGVNVKNASKVFMKVLFADLQESGKDVPKVVVTLKEYTGMILVIRLLEQGQVRKPIVFCPSAASCRRCMALLRLLLRRHSGASGENEHLEHVGSGHVFESATEYALQDGEPRKSKATMSLHARKYLLGEFQSAQSYVLFNTNLLSTGVDLPCCDGVVLLSPSEKKRTVLQRWGRSLRVESHNVDTKTGTLALVVEDPWSPRNWRRNGSGGWVSEVWRC